VIAQVHQQIPGGLGDPRTGRVGGDPGQMDPATLQLDDEEDVQSGQADRLNSQEVAGQRCGGLGAQELRRHCCVEPSR
jgi:hypothetical protein